MTNVYVGNISSRTRERDLRYKFEKYGRLYRCDLLNGFAFVEYEYYDDARDAIRALDGYDMDGKRLVVEQARNNRGDDRRGGGGGGGGRDRYDDRRGGGGGGRDSGAGTGIRGGAVRGSRENCVLVKGLALRTGWQQLKDWARGPRDTSRFVEYTDAWTENGKRFGVVKFDSSKDFKDALRHLDNTKLDGVYVRVTDDMDDKGSASRSRSRSRRRSRSRSRSRGRGSPARDSSRTRDASPRPARSRSPARASPAKQSSRSRSPVRAKSPSPARRDRSRSASPRKASRSRSRSRSD